MSTTITGTARRFVLTLSVAGIAALGGIAVAPAASAAEGNGPDMFVQLEHGKSPVFLCDDLNEHKRHNNCLDLDAPSRF